MTIARKTRFAATAAFAVTLAACSGLTVNSDFDPAANFGAFQTFEWLPDSESDAAGLAQDPLVDRRIRAAIDTDLQSKGFRRLDDGADFAVGYQLSTREDVSYTTMHSGWSTHGYGWGYWGPRTGVGISSSTTRRNVTTVGQLLIGIFDEESREMVWRGSGEKSLSNRQMSPQEMQEEINDIVSRIMETFPPGASQ
jgi:hypothetical protein